MKRLLLVLFVFVSLFVVAGTASAGSLTAQGIIQITCSATASVAVTTASYSGVYPFGVDTSTTTVLQYGLCQTGVTCIAATPFYVWNISLSTQSAVQKYSLNTTANTTNLAGGTNWTIGTTTGSAVNYCGVCGCFAATSGPALGSWTTAANTISTVVNPWVHGAMYDNGTGGYTTSTHGNPTAGTPTSINLWTAVMMPSAISSNAGETITITVTAAMAG